MTQSLAPDLLQIIEEKVASGVYSSPDEVIREGLRLLQERDDFYRFRQEALRRDIEAGLRQIESGQTRRISADDVKQRVRERLAGTISEAEQSGG